MTGTFIDPISLISMSLLLHRDHNSKRWGKEIEQSINGKEKEKQGRVFLQMNK